MSEFKKYLYSIGIVLVLVLLVAGLVMCITAFPRAFAGVVGAGFLAACVWAIKQQFDD
jgi:hypothetical protein